MYYVYVLRLANGKYYKGSTGNLRRRIAEHRQGQVASTYQYRPVRLVHYEVYLFKSDAARRERFLKTTEGRRLLRQQIKDLLNSL